MHSFHVSPTDVHVLIQVCDAQPKVYATAWSVDEVVMQLLHKFKGIFAEYIQTGKLAQMQEDSMSSRLGRKLKGI